MENTIEIKDLNFSFNKGKPILKNLNLAVPKGSVLAFSVPTEPENLQRCGLLSVH